MNALLYRSIFLRTSPLLFWRTGLYTIQQKLLLFNCIKSLYAWKWIDWSLKTSQNSCLMTGDSKSIDAEICLHKRPFEFSSTQMSQSRSLFGSSNVVVQIKFLFQTDQRCLYVYFILVWSKRMSSKNMKISKSKIL